MKKRKIYVLLLLCAAVLLSLSACGGKKPQAEITDLEMSESRWLTIDYAANRNVPAGEWKIRVSVSRDGEGVTGAVYCFATMDGELKKGQKFISIFDMASYRDWTVDGSLYLYGAKVLDTVSTENILSLFGDDATVTVAFLINDEVVSEMTLEE